MSWIAYSLIYALTNALYVAFNQKRRYNAYVLGMWRGFGITILISPLLLTVPLITNPAYYVILVLQGLMIGVYDSHIFLASAKYGANTASGFMATAVLITTFLWWSIDFTDLAALSQNPVQLITLFFILCAFSVSYWQMMKVHVNPEAEKFLYPAVFALALMSIATRYIALNGGTAYTGVVYYLTVSCFVSGLYNTVWFLVLKVYRPPVSSLAPKKNAITTVPLKTGLWLILFSTVLIAAKNLALRQAQNPGYVIALLLISPIFSQIIENKRLNVTPAVFLTITFLILLLIITT